ncbi:MAG: hydroxymethylglutaryl-CoA lyase [Planctomycetota bacterium]|jgi:hydroxymethylglutaryl-CoA lyase
MRDPKHIRITEVGPRDGLQDESAIVSTRDKVAFIDLLSESGVAEIEVSSFVSPAWVPQLRDADHVFRHIKRLDSVVYAAIVPNRRGLERALAANVDKVALVAAASPSFCRKNTNATIDEILEGFKPVIEGAKEARLTVRGYISCAVACPYEGPVAPSRVRHVADRLLEMGIDEIDLAETVGVAVPTDIDELYEGLDGLLAPAQTTLHLHDTHGTALSCVLRALQLGVVSFDASCGGLGGCPYAPGAAGNLATEDLVYMCDRMGYETGVDLERLIAATRQVAKTLGRPLSGRVIAAHDAAAGADSVHWKEMPAP